jgi:hypothetical protein
MRGTIRKNEAIGRKLERVMAEKLEGNVVGPEAGRSGPYDVENKCCLIEVKSCARVTCDKTVNGRKYCHRGRFVIVQSSHNALRVEAERLSKTPEYCFVMYEPSTLDVIKFKEVGWNNVDQLLKESATKYTKGGMTLLTLWNDKVFG